MSAIDLNTFIIKAPSKTTTAGFYLDGDYTNALPTGMPIPEYPYLDQNDTETVIFRQPMEQALRNYRPLVLTAPIRGAAGAYCLGDRNFRDGGCGIVTFERLIGNIPRQRKVSQSHSYAFQIVTQTGAKITTDPSTPGAILSYEGPTLDLTSQTATVESRVIYDYFIAGNEDDFPLRLRPYLIKVGYQIQIRGDALEGDGFPLYLAAAFVCSTDAFILAEDDVYEDWHGAIRCRKRRIIKGPTPQFWGSLLT